MDVYGLFGSFKNKYSNRECQRREAKQKEGLSNTPSSSLSIHHKSQTQNHQKWTTQEGGFTTPAFPFSRKYFF